MIKGMSSHEKRLSTITHNIANITTPGYKAFKLVFD